jgi:hypothetical protein
MLPILLGLLFQYQADPVRAAELAEKALQAETRAHAETTDRKVLAERKRFEAKYEALGRAMDAFTLAYNAGRGHIWPMKEAEALAKAIRELEGTSSWNLVSRRAGTER